MWEMICTGHGPRKLDTGLERIFQHLPGNGARTDNPNQNKTVILAYVSAYGYTKDMEEKKSLRGHP